MNHLHVRYLLVGGGVASSTAAEAIRRRDPEGEVLLVGQEINRPYHRPPLSKGHLLRKIPRKDLFTHSEAWFEENRVQLRTNRRVSYIETIRRAVTLDNGEEVSFDRLLLATGGSPMMLTVPGANLPNLFYLRTIEDEERLHHAVDKALAEGRPHDRGRGRAAVIGGGLLGVELCAALTQLGLHVELIAGSRHPWRRFAGESAGLFVARFLERHGVKVHLDHRAERLEGDGRVQRVVLTDGEAVQCDLAVASIGMIPNKDLLRGTPLAAGKAILADEHCRTNVPEIYAAGDCASVFDPLFGKHRLIDHWENARVTGDLAGRNMAGANASFNYVGHFTSELFGLRMAAWGEPRLVDRRIVRGVANIEAPDFLEIGVDAQGRVAHVLAVGDDMAEDVLEGLVRRRMIVEGREEHLKDPSTDLRSLYS